MTLGSVYAPRLARRVRRVVAGAWLACAASVGAWAQQVPEADAAISVAREAFRTGDRARLLTAREQLLQAGHPLAPWADYWVLVQRLSQATPAEVDAFLARWPDSYVADRGRNDWLLELGRRQDWGTFLRIQPGFRMDDDREVTCLGWLARFETRAPLDELGNWRVRARDAWLAQRDADAGCDAMARRFIAAGVFTQDDIWRKLRLMVETNRPRGIEQAARLLGGSAPTVVARLLDAPQAFLQARTPSGAADAARGGARTPGAGLGPTPERSPRRAKQAAQPPLPEVQATWRGPMSLLAFIRWATSDPAAAAAAMQDPTARQRWQWRAEEAAWAWAHLGRHSAWRFLPDAPAHFERALADLALASSTGEWRPQDGQAAAAWSTDTLQWMARAGLRAAVTGEPARWALVEQAIDAMPEALQRDGAWQYWKARALLMRAPAGAQGEPQRQQARALLARTADPFSFYGQLAHETLHRRPHPPATVAAPLTELERSWAVSHPGIDRALRLFALGWRVEAVREWNFTIGHARPGGFNDRELLAAADAACSRAIWDRCINTSDRTRAEFDLTQRYPTPFRPDVLRAARDVGLDPSFMYGLIRQESRFMPAARSHVGAAGLMQVMPATATWTARKLAIPYTPDRLTDPDTNLRLGAGYLRLVLDDFQGMQALAAAAYNAGPGRPRRWREGPTMEAAVWVENVPFTETRDYVKKVLANAVVYGQLLHGHSLSITNRLGPTVGPRAAAAPAESRELP